MKRWVSAGGLVVTREQDNVWVALIRDWKGRWVIPKGKVEKGETLGACAMREAREELGLGTELDLKILTKLHLQRLYFRLPKDPELQFKLVHAYLIQAEKRVPLMHQAEEHYTDAAWFTFAEAEKISYRQKEVFAKAHKYLFPKSKSKNKSTSASNDDGLDRGKKAA